MFAKIFAFQVDEVARCDLVAKVLCEEPGVVIVRNKADLLGVGLATDVGVKAERDLADFFLGVELAQRHQDVLELVLGKVAEDVGLVLALLFREADDVAAGVRELLDFGVVACSDVIGVEFVSFFDERVELDIFVAGDARVWGAAMLIFVYKVIYDFFSEDWLEVDDVEWDAYFVADAAGIIYGGQAAAAPLFFDVIGVVVFPKLHGDAYDVVAGFLEEPGGGGAVDTAAHADDDAVFVWHSIGPPFRGLLGWVMLDLRKRLSG